MPLVQYSILWILRPYEFRVSAQDIGLHVMFQAPASAQDRQEGQICQSGPRPGKCGVQPTTNKSMFGFDG